MATASEITPIILAGGASSRMGRPKALLDFDGKSCLTLALEAVRRWGTPIVVLGAAGEEIQEHVLLDAVQVTLNENWQRGQTSSLKAGLANLSSTAAAFLLYPVDFPLLSAAEVGRVVEAFTQCQDPNKAIFIPLSSGRRGHPVLCRREIASEFLALPDDTPARTVTIGNPQRIHYIDFEQADVFMDMDTPDEYCKCLKLYRSREQEKKKR